MALYLGLMSGTSADGISLAVVDINALTRPSGALSRKRERAGVRVLAHRTVPYPAALRARVLAAREASAAELAALNMELGGVWAAAAKAFLEEEGVAPARLRAIGSHGQTVVHLPRKATLQIGEPAVLAEALGRPVVADFRPRDVAAGGEGAPLMPFMDEWLFGAGPCRAVQNLGGIGNVSVVGRGGASFGFDTGPGNCLMDLAVSRLTRGRKGFDEDGRLAAAGKADEGLARRALRAPFFLKRPPRSADRGDFDGAFLKRFSRLRRSEDLLATLNYFTALSVADAYERFVFPRRMPTEVLLSGGGALNPVLVENLRFMLPIPVRLPEDYGIPALAKEAACFALLAARALDGKPNNVPAATGARGPRVLGKIVPA